MAPVPKGAAQRTLSSLSPYRDAGINEAGPLCDTWEIHICNSRGKWDDTIPMHMIELFTLDTFGGLVTEHWKLGKVRHTSNPTGRTVRTVRF
eukprot:4982203-Pyramimonas_sp.AAC.2